MKDPDLHDSHPAVLARLLDAGSSDQGAWAGDELGAILWFQLAAPLSADVGSDDARVRGRLMALQTVVDPPIRTFNDLLHHSNPPLELLEIVKEFAKDARRDPENRLPREVATVLYYACIGVALARYNHRLTGLDDGPFREGVAWVLTQPWVDELTKSILRAIPSTGEEKKI